MSAHVESVGAGAPLVLLHGWGLHGGLFAPLLPGLARRFRVHVVDLPGHGHSPAVATRRSTRSSTRSPMRSPTSGAARGAGLVARGPVRDALGAPRSRADRPARARGDVAALRVRRRLAARDERDDAARFGDEFAVSWKLTMQRFLALQVHGSESGRATLAALRHQLFARGEPSRAALGEALRVLATSDLRGEVGAIDAPTLVVSGERDMLAPAAAGAWLGEAMPQRPTCASTARRTRRSCRTGKRSIARSTDSSMPLIAPPPDPRAPEPRAVRRAFARAAASYDAAAALQREVSGRLAERLDVVKLVPAAVLDAGCGTGEALGELAARYPDARTGRARRRGADGRRRARALAALALAGDAAARPARARRGRAGVRLRRRDRAAVRAFERRARVVEPRAAVGRRSAPRVRGVPARARGRRALTFTTFGPDTLKELARASPASTATRTSAASSTCTTSATCSCTRASPIR
jgi:pimeloyl-[acyl-carrier protein] methyl ester esterase